MGRTNCSYAVPLQHGTKMNIFTEASQKGLFIPKIRGPLATKEPTVAN
jgi:hypothetical protein